MVYHRIQMGIVTTSKKTSVGERRGDKSGPYLSSLWVGDTGVAEITALPFGVEAVAL